MEYNSSNTEVLGERRMHDGNMSVFLLHTDEHKNHHFIIAENFKERRYDGVLGYEHWDFSWERARYYDSLDAAAGAWSMAVTKDMLRDGDEREPVRYRVFNPGNGDGIGPKRPARHLPEPVFEYARKLIEERAGAERETTLLNAPLESIPEDILGPRELADIMDRWAIEESFDPEKVAVEEAAWVVKDPAGHQAAYEVHLADDEISPNGFAWYTEMYVFDPGRGKWVSDDSGMWWGYGNAPELAAEMPMPSSIDWDNAQVVRAPYGLLDDLGVWDDEGRVASVEEIEAFKELDWEQIDTPKSELTPTPRKQDVPPARACNVSVAESLEVAKKQASMARQAKVKPSTAKMPKL